MKVNQYSNDMMDSTVSIGLSVIIIYINSFAGVYFMCGFIMSRFTYAYIWLLVASCREDIFASNYSFCFDMSFVSCHLANMKVTSMLPSSHVCTHFHDLGQISQRTI